MKRITEQPFKGIVDREWIRAKRILPVLKRKPKVAWSTGHRISLEVRRSGCVGYCDTHDNTIVLHEGYKNLTDHKEFVLTLRHEFAHLPKTNQSAHGSDFQWWMKKLGGTYHSKYYEYELAGRIPRKGSYARRHYEKKHGPVDNSIS